MGYQGLNERISTARKSKNWTQKGLADALKVNLKNVSRWELGSSAPSFEAVIAISQVLGVSLEFLAGIEQSNGKSELSALFNAKVDKLSKQQINALKTVLNHF